MSVAAAAYNGLDWGEDNRKALANGWILTGNTLEELALRIQKHPDNRGKMDAALLRDAVENYNSYCAAKHDPDF